MGDIVYGKPYEKNLKPKRNDILTRRQNPIVANNNLRNDILTPPPDFIVDKLIDDIFHEIIEEESITPNKFENYEDI